MGKLLEKKQIEANQDATLKFMFDTIKTNATDEKVWKELRRSKKNAVLKVGRIRNRAILKITMDRLGIQNPELLREFESSFFDSMRFHGSKKASDLFRHAVSNCVDLLVRNKIKPSLFLKKLLEVSSEIDGTKR